MQTRKRGSRPGENPLWIIEISIASTTRRRNLADLYVAVELLALLQTLVFSSLLEIPTFPLWKIFSAMHVISPCYTI
jgi:hypothetical protein